MVWIAPVGTPAAVSRAIQWARVCSIVTASISRLSSRAFCTRAGLVAKRSSPSSGSASAMHSFSNSASLPAAITNSPSLAWNVSKGAISGWRAPEGCGALPVTVVSAIACSRIATWLSSIDTSTRRPPPPRARSTSAARIPWLRNIPATMSPIEAPTRTGSRPFSPVIDITPPRACTTMS